MHAAPIQPRAMTQTAVRSGTEANKLASIADFGIHHASQLVRWVLSQSRVMSVGLLLMGGLGTTPGDTGVAGTLGLNRWTLHRAV
jgi:hypothetical protein